MWTLVQEADGCKGSGCKLRRCDWSENTISWQAPPTTESHVYGYCMNNSDITALIDPNSIIKAGMVDKVWRVWHKSKNLVGSLKVGQWSCFSVQHSCYWMQTAQKWWVRWKIISQTEHLIHISHQNVKRFLEMTSSFCYWLILQNLCNFFFSSVFFSSEAETMSSAFEKERDDAHIRKVSGINSLKDIEDFCLNHLPAIIKISLKCINNMTGPSFMPRSK